MSVIENGPMAAVPLISFRPPPDIQRAIDARGFNWHIHPVEFGIGPLNLDNYRIKIVQHPSVRGLDTTEGLFKYIRLNINQFVDTDKCEFEPYSDSDSRRWNTDLPIGTVMHIDFGRGGPLNLEDGSVVCSAHSDNYWIFSTVWTGDDFNHPVSGNRQFGYYSISGPGLPGDGTYIYTRAADRVTDNIVNGALINTIFDGGHKTWLDFQQRMARFVNSKGGKAEVLPAFSARYEWSKMKDQHRPTTEWIKSRHYIRTPRNPDRELSTRGGPV